MSKYNNITIEVCIRSDKIEHSGPKIKQPLYEIVRQ